jgi:RimJ/RimL family protein N-acetyltransferase
MNIKGKRITLRAIESDDLPVLHSWFNDPEIASGLGGIHFPSSLNQQEKWFERIQSDDATIRLSVENDEGKLIGYSGFWQIDWRDRRAEHALVVGKEFQGRKYGQEIIMTCARYGFDEMGLHRLEATVLESNGASLKIYQSCGFTQEGALREHALRGGQWVNRILLSVLAEEYRTLINENHYWESED